MKYFTSRLAEVRDLISNGPKQDGVLRSVSDLTPVPSSRAKRGKIAFFDREKAQADSLYEAHTLAGTAVATAAIGILSHPVGMWMSRATAPAIEITAHD